METKIIIDNATLAAAGRATYSKNVGVLSRASKNHILEYYNNYPTAALTDIKSLSELISALVLYDSLIWNRGSFVEEEKEQFTSNLINENCWVYSWFPDFKIAYHNDILLPFNSYRNEEIQYQSQNYALDWVSKNYREYTSKLTTDFKIPNAYFSDKYHYLPEFQEKNKKYKLNNDELAAAMFIHRGLFYLSFAHSKEGLSYLPHAHRSIFLVDDELSLYSYLASGSRVFSTRAVEIQDRIEEILEAKRNHAIGGASSFQLNAIGGAFIHKYGVEKAFSEALNFRLTDKGKEVRQQFRLLTDAGNKSDNITVNMVLKQISRDIDTIIKSKLGGSISDIIKFEIIPSWASYLLDYLPIDFQKNVVKASSKSIRTTGFQLIFGEYLA